MLNLQSQCHAYRWIQASATHGHQQAYCPCLIDWNISFCPHWRVGIHSSSVEIHIKSFWEVYITHVIFNSSPPSAAYLHQWIGWALVQIMACSLLGANPSSEPVSGYCQWNPWEETADKFLIKIQNFLFTKMHLKISSVKLRSFCFGGDEFNVWWFALEVQ